jgi:hypothetical protein
MVIDGTTIPKSHVAWVKFEGDRIRLPDHIVQLAKHAGFAGREQIHGWLFLVRPGRYRLVTERTEELTKILDRIEESEAPGGLFDGIDNDPEAASPIRLIPCSISPPRPGWRVNFPKEARNVVPQGEERPSSVYVLISAGFIEIWFPNKVIRAGDTPIEEILP